MKFYFYDVIPSAFSTLWKSHCPTKYNEIIHHVKLKKGLGLNVYFMFV